jgi:hypothetical protein
MGVSSPALLWFSKLGGSGKDGNIVFIQAWSWGVVSPLP